MKIIELKAENIKRLVAVTIKPDNNLVEISGKNGQGKTSVLDAIWWALEGQKNIQAVPIRKGATEARIRLDLGELKITRTFKMEKDKTTKEPTGGFTTTITVENADGARFPSPQAVIDGLLGALSFDPLAFTRMKAGEQLEALKQFVPDIDFDAIAKANGDDYIARTDVNRRIKELRAQESAIVIDGNAPAVLIDESALSAELEAAGKFNADIERRKSQRKATFDNIERMDEQATEKESRIERLRAEIETLSNQAQELRVSIHESRESAKEESEIPSPLDTSAIRGKMEKARRSNQLYTQNQNAKEQKDTLANRIRTGEARAEALTAAIDSRKKQKADAITSAKLPIEGIGFGDGVVLMNGVPFDQASDAEQLRASINIAAAMNPKLRVIRVRDGSLLDEDAMKLLAEFAESNDLQVWIERVDSTGRVGFVMENGEVKS